VQRVGRGIRLTPEGELLAGRAGEILGRVDAAATELAAQVGLRSGRVRVAANASALSTVVTDAVRRMGEAHPDVEVVVHEQHPVEALEMLRNSAVDVAVVFRYADAPVEHDGFRFVPIGEDRIYLISQRAGDRVADHRDSGWIGGCVYCQEELTAVCQRAGFTPRIASLSDDIIVVQALVAAGVGVTTLPGLALQAHRRDDIHATVIDSAPRRLYAVTYGEPPDPPAVTALVEALLEAASARP
jgi:DNA-binding transcriptional LysR family regulator